MTYAKGTSTTVASSQHEIGQTLSRYKVHTYAFGQEPGKAIVSFKMGDLPIRVGIPLPAHREGKRRAANGRMVDIEREWEQEVREAWRALVLLIKANLEAIERKIVTPEQAFMAYLVLPSGETVGDVVLPKYTEALASGSRLALTAG